MQMSLPIAEYSPRGQSVQEVEPCPFNPKLLYVPAAQVEHFPTPSPAVGLEYLPDGQTTQEVDPLLFN